MRLFTGLALPPSVVNNIEELMQDLPPDAGIRWTPLPNLHITTKFIGEWPEARLSELKSRLALEIASFRLNVEGIGFFPHARAPRILFAGVAPSSGLAELAASTEAALLSLGVPNEDRPYSPHVTLGRLSKPLPPGLLLKRDFGGFEAREFHLYQSRNSSYIKLATFPLK